MDKPREKTLFDFSGSDSRPWESIDDSIMGGFSQSGSEITGHGSLLFSGSVSLENQGGFASVRSPAGDYDLGGYTGILLRVKGDGKDYQLGLRIDLFFDGVSYLAGFNPPRDNWGEIFLPFNAFAPTHHGQQLPNAAPLDTHHIRSFLLLIAGQQAGPFRLEIAWVKAVHANQTAASS